MTQAIAFAFGFLIDALLPPRKTERLIRTLTPEALHALAAVSEEGREVLPYHEPQVRALVWELKYRRNPHALALAGQFLGEEVLAAAEETFGEMVLVPIPMHTSRRQTRGYNQCELLCDAIVRHTSGSVGYEADALVRVRNTPPQQGLAKYRRLKNILGAIEVKRPERVAGKVCIVVDDVRTTGATLAEAERALLAAGAARVRTITLAQS